jgi:hypothetical protein
VKKLWQNNKGFRASKMEKFLGNSKLFIKIRNFSPEWKNRLLNPENEEKN